MVSQLHKLYNRKLTEIFISYYKHMFGIPPQNVKKLKNFLSTGIEVFISPPDKQMVIINYQKYADTIRKVFEDIAKQYKTIVFNDQLLTKKRFGICTMLLDLPPGEAQFIGEIIYGNAIKILAGKKFALELHYILSNVPLTTSLINILYVKLLNFYNLQRYLSAINKDNWDEEIVYGYIVYAYLTLLEISYEYSLKSKKIRILYDIFGLVIDEHIQLYRLTHKTPNNNHLEILAKTPFYDTVKTILSKLRELKSQYVATKNLSTE